MVKYVKGDLFESQSEIISHGCNCQGGFGAGVAHTMAMRYPKARHHYLDKYDEDGWKLGDVQFVRQWDGKIVANCATQEAYFPRGICHADYGAIRTCMEKVKQYALDQGLSVGMPKIGAGLAGGDWSIIEEILGDVFSDYDVTVYYLE